MMHCRTRLSAFWPHSRVITEAALVDRSERRHDLGKNKASRHNQADQATGRVPAPRRRHATRRGRAVIDRIVGAAVRAVMVAALVAMPALALPSVSYDVTQITALAALLAAILTFVEYSSAVPSVTEFRDSPPFNRLRFIGLATCLVLLTLNARNFLDQTPFSAELARFGYGIGQRMDFPFSPIRLILTLLPDGTDPALVALVRAEAGLAHVISFTMVIFFVGLIRILNWPIRRHAFNVWVNLPLFDPTSGGDVLHRLKRDAHFNVALGFLLPFLIPAAVKVAAAAGGTLPLMQPLALVWVMTAWAFLPASLMMRGVALIRIADLIEEKRRRAYAQSDELQPA